jgi:hypothetical protein
VPFECASNAALILGTHNGVDSWTVHVGHERSRSEQRLVSAHERLHHELHSTTPWGFITSVVGGRHDRAEARPVWRWLAEGCRTTHEVFATYFAVLLDDTNPQLLAGNTTYEQYLQIGEELRDRGPQQDALPHLHVDGLLRAVMAPRQLLDLDPDDVMQLRLGDVRDEWLPDERLRRLRSLLAGATSGNLSHGPDRHSVGADFGFVSYRDEVARYLTSLGLPSMTVAEERDWTMALFTAAQDAGLGVFEVINGPRDIIGSLFEDYQRERLRLWSEPLPIVTVSPEDPAWDSAWLIRGHQLLGPHAWLVWLRGDYFRRQFEVPEDLAPGARPFLGYLAVDRTHGEPVARLWPFDLLSPSDVADQLRRSTGLRVVFFTTLSTLLASADADSLRGIEPAFVLIDTSFTDLLDQSRESGAVITYRTASLHGDRNLALLIIEKSDQPGVVYLLATSLAAAEIIRIYLDRLPDDQVMLSSGTAGKYEPYLDALIRHLVGSFYQLDLYGGTAR